MRTNPIFVNTLGLLTSCLFESHDCLSLALDAAAIEKASREGSAA